MKTPRIESIGTTILRTRWIYLPWIIGIPFRIFTPLIVLSTSSIMRRWIRGVSRSRGRPPHPHPHPHQYPRVVMPGMRTRTRRKRSRTRISVEFSGGCAAITPCAHVPTLFPVRQPTTTIPPPPRLWKENNARNNRSHRNRHIGVINKGVPWHRSKRLRKSINASHNTP